MVLAAFGCMNNVCFEKNIKRQHYARCVYYWPEITTCTSNLKNTVLVLIDLQSNPPKRPQSTVDTLF